MIKIHEIKCKGPSKELRLFIFSSYKKNICQKHL